MTRREIFRLLLAGPLASLVPRGSKARPETPRRLLNRFSVAGLRYYEGPALLAMIRKGDMLDLKADPGNAYDRFAVRVLHPKGMLGYVPRSDNRHISRLLLQGADLECRVIETDPSRLPWSGLRVRVDLCGCA